MNLGFYILFLVMLTSMTVLLENESKTQSRLLDIPRFAIVVMSLFHLLKEVFQIWDEVRQCNVDSKPQNCFILTTTRKKTPKTILF